MRQIIVALVLVSLMGCSGSGDEPDKTIRTASAEINLLAPVDAICAVIAVAGQTNSTTHEFDIAPKTSTIFVLQDLPLGTDVFTAQAFSVPCSQIAGASASWVADPVKVTVTAEATVNTTLEMKNARQGSGTVGLVFSSLQPVIIEFPIPAADSYPVDIAAGPDNNLWFTELVGNKIGRITTSGTITEFSIPTLGSSPSHIAAGSDGNLWFTESSAMGNKIGRITTSGAITEFLLPIGHTRPAGIAVGLDGNLWFTESEYNTIGRITTFGTITEFRLPTAGDNVPYAIAAGSDGNLWFVEFAGNKIGRITTSGTITEFPLPTAGSSPLDIAAGSDGNLWFTEGSGNKIGWGSKFRRDFKHLDKKRT